MPHFIETFFPKCTWCFNLSWIGTCFRTCFHPPWLFYYLIPLIDFLITDPIAPEGINFSVVAGIPLTLTISGASKTESKSYTKDQMQSRKITQILTTQFYQGERLAWNFARQIKDKVNWSITSQDELIKFTNSRRFQRF